MEKRTKAETSRENGCKGGRPRLEIDLEQFKKLCSLHCTQLEIASFFNLSVDTVQAWCLRELGIGFTEAFKIHSSQGKISLRRYQFKAAEKGNVAMLIWLGKQFLGQTDKVENVSDDLSLDEKILIAKKLQKQLGL